MLTAIHCNPHPKIIHFEIRIGRMLQINVDSRLNHPSDFNWDFIQSINCAGPCSVLKEFSVDFDEGHSEDRIPGPDWTFLTKAVKIQKLKLFYLETWSFLATIESDCVELKFWGPPTTDRYLDEDYSLPTDLLQWLSKFKKLIRLVPTVRSLKYEHFRVIQHPNAYLSINKDNEILKLVSGSSEAQEAIDSLIEYKDKLRTTSITWSKTEHFDFIRPEQPYFPEVTLKCDDTLRVKYDQYVLKVSKLMIISKHNENFTELVFRCNKIFQMWPSTLSTGYKRLLFPRIANEHKKISNI